MIPLIFSDIGDEGIIKKVGGNPDVRQHLAELGFNVGSPVTVITAMNGNVIVKVKESRVAVDRALAEKIMI